MLRTFFYLTPVRIYVAAAPHDFYGAAPQAPKRPISWALPLRTCDNCLAAMGLVYQRDTRHGDSQFTRNQYPPPGLDEHAVSHITRFYIPPPVLNEHAISHITLNPYPPPGLSIL